MANLCNLNALLICTGKLCSRATYVAASDRSSTAQITNAMQMVAASKMRKAQQAALDASFCASDVPYPARSDDPDGEFSHPLLEVREVRKRAVILVGADKGLCGALKATCFAWQPSLIPQSTVFITAGVRRAQFVAATRRQLVAEFALRRRASIPGSQADCRFRPRPFFEEGGG